MIKRVVDWGGSRVTPLSMSLTAWVTAVATAIRLKLCGSLGGRAGYELPRPADRRLARPMSGTDTPEGNASSDSELGPDRPARAC